MNAPESSSIGNTFGTNSIDCINDKKESSDCVPKKMNKKAKLRAMSQLLATPGPNIYVNIHNVPRKLIIFDINKVLLYRQAKSSKYIIRPYAHEFIAGMSERFTIAVWTSMTKRFAKPIIAELFPPDRAPLLFYWNQTMCRAIPADNKKDKPLFLKELSKVWDHYRRFNESNTLLIDDSCEKCVCNPVWTSVHPLPYEPYQYRPRPPPPQYPPILPPHPCSAVTGDPSEICIDDEDDATSGPHLGIGDPAELCIDEEEDVEEGTCSHRPDHAGICIVEDAAATKTAVVVDLTASTSDSTKPSPVGQAIAAPTKTAAVVDLTASTSDPTNPNPSPVCQAIAVPTKTAAVVDLTACTSDLTNPNPNPVCQAIAAPTTTASTTGTGMVNFPYMQDTYNMPNINTIQNSNSIYAPYTTTTTTTATSTVQGDIELIPHGPLWEYLDRLAQYDGAVRDLFELCGPYTPTLPK